MFPFNVYRFYDYLRTYYIETKGTEILNEKGIEAQLESFEWN